jgi:hypothetical protein
MLPHLRDVNLPEALKKIPNWSDIPKNEPIYIQICNPGKAGLGDALLFSTLPEEFYRQFAFENIYIVNPPEGYYNQEVPNLIWGYNPFVTGQINSFNANTFNIKEVGYYLADIIRRHYKNNIKTTEALNNLTPTNFYPKIYYTPKFRKEFGGKIYADYSSYSNNFTDKMFSDFINYCSRVYNFDSKEVIMIQSNNMGNNGSVSMTNNPRYIVKNLEEYCDLIYSCKMFLPVQSGAAALASAIKGLNYYPKVVEFISAASLNTAIWSWANLEYITTGQISNDFEHR